MITQSGRNFHSVEKNQPRMLFVHDRMCGVHRLIRPDITVYNGRSRLGIHKLGPVGYWHAMIVL